VRSRISAAGLLEDTSCRAISWSNLSAVMGIITKQIVCSVFICNRKYENEGKGNRISTKCTNNWVTKQRFGNSTCFRLRLKDGEAPTKLISGNNYPQQLVQ
jgi:hypothetical protein